MPPLIAAIDLKGGLDRFRIVRCDRFEKEVGSKVKTLFVSWFSSRIVYIYIDRCSPFSLETK